MDPDPESFVFDYSLLTGFAFIAFLLLCSAFISGAETALFSLLPEDLDKINNKAPQKGKIIAQLLEKPKKLLATLVITTNFLNIAVIIMFFRYSDRLFEEVASPWLKFAIEILILTFSILLFGKVVPKVYAARNTTRFSKKVAYTVFALNKLLSPLSVPMREITLLLHKKFGGQRTAFSIDQLSQALELTDYGDATDEEQKILEGIVTFGNTDVKQVMCPRIDIFAIDIEETFADIFPKIVSNGFSRIPVYKDNIDHITGVLFVKDLIPYIDEEVFVWQDIIREPFFIPENKKLDNLLKEFQGMKNHLAIVVDEYGGTSGLVSLEDILEEIVGDISDEFDDEDIIYSRIDENNFLFDGKINIKDFCRIIEADEAEYEEAKGEAETLAGLVLEMSGNFPKKGQKINFKGNIFTVESFDKRRIRQIKVTLHK